MRTNTDATIYNKHIEARDDVYQRATILKIAWQNIRAISKLKSGGDIAANKVVAYIPKSSGALYLDPKVWQALADKTGYWTLQEGDIIVRGVVDDEISALFTITDLKAKYDDVLAISEVDPHLYGSRGLQHWKVSAK